uniref:Uncharacterized protein n=1 Tax=viral metagenome TaxID=1070528 RepID=A0A6C0CC26_9ZZZZ
MKLNIYRLYISHKDSPKFDIPEVNVKNISLSNDPSPKLIKYGFNKTTDNFNVIDLMKDDHYKIGLNFDFDRTDAESINVVGKKTFNITGIDHNFCMFWEILNLFGMLAIDQTILTNIKNTMTNITSVYNKMTKAKVNTKIYETMPPKEKASLIVNKYSDVDLEEDAVVHLIINDLQRSIPLAAPGSSMIFQIFSCQTAIMTELIFFMMSLFNEAYIIKPLTSSDLSNEKFLVLGDMKKKVSMFDIPKKYSSSTYMSSLNIDLPVEYVTIIQCINSELIPQKFLMYNNIQAYIRSKMYEGAQYQELYRCQNKNIASWIEMFTDFSKFEDLLKSTLDKSDKKCILSRRIENVFD